MKMRKMAKYVNWTGISVMIIGCLFALTMSPSRKIPLLVAAGRFIIGIILIFLGYIVHEQKCDDTYTKGYDHSKFFMDKEIEKATRHLRQENKDLQDIIFSHEEAIIELEKNAGCYEGEGLIYGRPRTVMWWQSEVKTRKEIGDKGCEG